MKKGSIFLAAAVLAALAGCQEKESQPEQPEEEIVQMPEEEEQEEGIREYEVTLSDKLSDFEFAIDGETVTIPSKLEEWNKKGWEYKPKKEEGELDGESYVEGELLTKEENTLTVDLVNPESEKKPLSASYVGGVVLEYQEKGPVFQLPGNITVGKSVLNEVTEQYGTPTDEYEEKDEIYVTYEFGVYKEAEFIFDIQEEVLSGVSLKNYREPEDESETISKEEPEAVKSYVEPQELSENPADYVVSYDQQLYQIPAPVSCFTENGWKIEQEGSDTYVKAGRHGYVTLEKDGHTIYGVVKNYGDQTIGMEHAFMTNVSGDFDVTKVPIAVADGITLGMAEEEMKSRFGENTYETSEEEKGISYYLYSDETKKNFIRILVDKDLKLVREIEVSNSPDTLGNKEEDSQTQAPESSALIDEEKLPDAQPEE